MNRKLILSFLPMLLYLGKVNGQSGNPNPNPSLVNVVPPPPGLHPLVNSGIFPLGTPLVFRK